MKKYLLISVIFFFGYGWINSNDITSVHLNSIGFLPDAVKKASITQACSNFELKKASDNTTVFTGKVTGPFHQDDVNQDIWIADFSAFADTGEYYLEARGAGKSTVFKIADNVYNFPYITCMRGFYLWRCGTAVEGDFKGQHFAHAACHMNDAYQDYIGIKDSKKDGTKGWHDAGDYGKYTVNAGITVGMLFMAWDQFKDKLNNISLDLPETASGYPDFLEEIKWETDWLLTMQYPDGSGRISHKLTRLNFSDFIMPEKDTAKRYFTEWSSAATADFVAMMAMAARYFKPYDAAYAQTCLNAAKNSYNYLEEHPEFKRFKQGDFHTGGYQVPSDRDDRLWAAAEMWETTGDKVYLKDFETRATAFDKKIDSNWDWDEVKNMGMFTYALSKREGKDAGLYSSIKNAIISVADSIVKQGERDVYGRPFGGVYFWGCNGAVARQAVNLQVANLITPNKEYTNTIISILDHLFGRNYYNRSYITGLGLKPPMHPHDRRSGADNIEEPWPGYFVGGGHTATGWHDVQADYSTNEIAINWQAALVYALADVVK